MGGAIDAPAHHAIDLLEFPHQSVIRVQAPGRIDEKYVRATRFGGFQGIEGYRSGITSLLPSQEVRSDSIRPHLQLLHRPCAKRVGGADHHGAAVFDQRVGELRHGCRLSDAVHANHEVHGRAALGGA